jgi:hypothetical protein
MTLLKLNGEKRVNLHKRSDSYRQAMPNLPRTAKIRPESAAKSAPAEHSAILARLSKEQATLAGEWYFLPLPIYELYGLSFARRTAGVLLYITI